MRYGDKHAIVTSSLFVAPQCSPASCHGYNEPPATSAFQETALVLQTATASALAQAAVHVSSTGGTAQADVKSIATDVERVRWTYSLPDSASVKAHHYTGATHHHTGVATVLPALNIERCIIDIQAPALDERVGAGLLEEFTV